MKRLRLEIELFCVLGIGLIFVLIDRLRTILCHKIKDPPLTPNILFIQIYGVGNFILSSTTQIAIRQHFPEKKIFAVVHPAIKELAEKSPYLDEIIVYQDRRLRGKIRLIQEIRKTNFDLAIDLSGTYWTAWLARLSRAPKRVGFNAVGVQRLGFKSDGSGGLYTVGIPFNYDMHMKEFYERFLAILNIPLKDKTLKIFPSVEDDKFAKEVLREFETGSPGNNPVITIHIGARQKEKLWGVEKFAELINYLILKKGVNIILLGGQEDIERSNKILYQMGLSLLNSDVLKDKTIISLVGKTTLYQLAAVISKSHLFIGHDSGTMHIACAVHTKVVALFGPTIIKLWRPWLKESVVVQSEIECRGCNKIGHFFKCKENVCMSEISVEQVLNAVEKLAPLSY